MYTIHNHKHLLSSDQEVVDLCLCFNEVSSGLHRSWEQHHWKRLFYLFLFGLSLFTARVQWYSVEIRMLLCMCVSSVFTMLLLHYSNSFCLHYFTIAKQVCVCVRVCACACGVRVCVCVCVLVTLIMLTWFPNAYFEIYNCKTNKKT